MRTVAWVMVITVVMVGALSFGEPPAAVRGRELCFELADGTVITGRTDVKVITIRIASGNVLKVPVADLTELIVGLKKQRGSVERSKPQSEIRAGETILLGTVTVRQFRIASPYGNVTVKLDDIHRIRPGFRAVSGMLGRWAVELRDKTRLKGKAIGQSLRVQTRYGTMVVPLAQIQQATFATDGKSIRVQCWGADRIAGAIGPDTTISLKTDKGRVDVPAGKTALVACWPVTHALDLGKGVTLKLVRIPAGKFLMGSPKAETGHQNQEGPQRRVTISKPFYMGAHEVTQSQWRAVMGTAPWNGKTYAKSGASNAASYIGRDDASKFCRMLSKKTGRKVSLPTEAQWEYACRAGSKTAYSFGDDVSKLGDYAWYDKNASEKDEKYAHAVGHKKPNAFGLYDMHGNVYEWCRDWYDANFYSKAKNVDPENTTETNALVLRGGSWGSISLYCRAAYRGNISADVRNIDYGFRVVVESGSGVD